MCDTIVSIHSSPNVHPLVDSLNVSVATGILLHYLTKYNKSWQNIVQFNILVLLFMVLSSDKHMVVPFDCLMVFDATFNNISVLLVEESEGPCRKSLTNIIT